MGARAVPSRLIGKETKIWRHDDWVEVYAKDLRRYTRSCNPVLGE